MIRSVQYGCETIRFETLFLSTRKTLAIEVHPDQRVLVRAPAGCPERVIAERVHRRAAWILKQIAAFRQYEPRMPTRRYISGETHFFLGRQYRLKVATGHEAGVGLTRSQLQVTVPRGQEPRRVRSLLDAWYRERARELFIQVLADRLQAMPSVRPPRIVVRALRCRWGTCRPPER